MSDRILSNLSDITISYGLEDLVDKGYLVDVMYLMYKYEVKYPMSYNFMKELWEVVSNVSFDLMLEELGSSGLLSIRAVRDEVFFGSDNINKSLSDLEGLSTLSGELYLVVYGTDLWNRFIKDVGVLEVLDDSNDVEDKVIVIESVNFGGMDRKYKEFVSNLAKMVRNRLYLNILAESFDYDSIKNEIEFNFVVGIDRIDKKVRESDLTRIFKKHLKNPILNGFEVYVDGKDKLFINVIIDMRGISSDYKDIAKKILNALDEVVQLVG
jgi:hypothetical protein